MADTTLEEIISCPQLPSLPSVAIRVIELSQDADVQISDIAEVIQNDQALTAKILKTVNSSFYRLSYRCDTISRAMTYLGLNTIKSLVLGFSLVRLCKEQADGDALARHWRRVVYSAAAARRIARELGQCDPEEAFTAALMQDIGGLAMHASMNGEYARIVNKAAEDHFRLPEIERRAFGFDHAEVGAALAERWKLPESLVEVIKHHHSPTPGAHHLLRTIILSTQLAEIAAVPGHAGADQSDRRNQPGDRNTGTEPLTADDDSGASICLSAMLERFASCGADWYDMNPETTGELVRLVTEDAAELADLLNVNVGNPPDVADIMARAEEVSLIHQMRVQRENERLQKQNLSLSRMAQTCGLTGLANRRRFDQELRAHADHALNTGDCLAIIFIDVDHFKLLNDTLGHQAGDIALIELAGRIKADLPVGALACRYGGEEFVVMLPGTNRARAARMAEDIRLRVSGSPIDLTQAVCEQSSALVTVSAGVASIEAQTRHVVSGAILLLKAADRALYHAKLNGRNQVQVFAPAPQRVTDAA